MKNVLKPVFIYGSMWLAARRQRSPQRRGQTLVEYALILSVISIVLVGLIVNLGQQISPVYSTVLSQLSRSQTSH